jgi:hypothetical protein
MKNRKSGLSLRIQAVLAMILSGAAARAQDGPVNFATDVLPILSDRCLACHGPDPKNRKADLRLDQREAAVNSGAIVPGKADESELVARITSHAADELMPPPKLGKPLTEKQIATLKQWVSQGAPWGRHWAWEKPVRPSVQKVTQSTWARNPIDAFVLAGLEKKGLKPQPEARREELVRRVSLDLTGLPPNEAELQLYLNDKSADAYEKLVERLMASPRYGERLAWDWLDAARYADTNGYQGDGERTMWPWRDWVVRAFNADMPYDKFTVDQIAGDLVPQARQDQILATGFNRNHMINGEGGRIAEENRVEYLFDQTETVSTMWLGLTMTCARCHDHKFDPISKRDYFQLLAFFNQTAVNGGGGSGQTAPVLEMVSPQDQAAQKKAAADYDALLKQIAAKEAKLREAGMVISNGVYSTKLPVVIESTLRKGPNDRIPQNYDELAKFYGPTEPEYIRQLQQLRKLKQVRDEAAARIVKVMVMADMPMPRETFMLTRGNYEKREEKVAADVLQSFKPAQMQSPGGRPQNRLDLARWLVSPDNPLTARVTVNRYWQMLFGQGLVKTTEDFGLQGQLPSHPELLDWLALEFQQPLTDSSAQPWSVKHLLKLIVTSATYRQNSSAPAQSWAGDPENRMLGRGPRHRLPSWMIRDQALAVAGLLNPAMGGPAINAYQPPGIWEEATFGNKQYRQDHGAALYRRSLYLFWRRIVGPTIFFDNANRQTCTVKSVTTNTPLHALVTLNDTTYVEAARVLAEKAIKNGGADDAQKLGWLFRQALVRPATVYEMQLLESALKKQRALFANDRDLALKLVSTGEHPRDTSLNHAEHAAWSQVAALLLNLSETVTRN